MQLENLLGLFLPIFLGLTAAQNIECPENEEWAVQCGRECKPTCRGKPEHCQCQKPSLINDLCRRECLCKKGYFRDQPGGKCVLVEECHKIVQCSENEEYSECKSDCEPSCQNRKPQTSQKSVGCVCKKGYIRAGPGDKCVPESCENVTICQGNQIWSTCVSCPSFCNETENFICPMVCFSGCDCKPGHIRKSRSNGTCIALTECPCKENEIYRECGTPCPATCSQPDRPCYKKSCLRGCSCKDGFVRHDSTKQCVKRSECPKKENKNGVGF